MIQKPWWPSRIVLPLLLFSISSLVCAETVELVTYYPAAANSSNEHVNDLTVGPGYLAENPNDGVALIETALGIGTNNPQEQLQITGNLRLPATTATAGVIMSGNNRFIHRFGGSNFFAGTDAGNFTLTGSANVGIGINAMQSLTDGTQNVAVGTRAMESNTRGERNSAFGMESLNRNTTGDLNTGMGHNTLYYNTTGFDNTAVGYQALLNNSTGTDNVAVGQNAGSALLANANTTGSGNTFIGTRSGSGAAAQLTNATAIGFEALVSASNALVLGGTGADTVNVGIGVATPQTPAPNTQAGNLDVNDIYLRSTGQWLSRQGVFLMKTIGTGNPSTTLLTDPHLQFTMLAGETWAFEIVCKVNFQGAKDIVVSLTHPTVASGLLNAVVQIITSADTGVAGAPGTVITGQIVGSNATVSRDYAGTTTGYEGIVTIMGSMTASASGTFGFSFAERVHDATYPTLPSVERGSYLRARRLAPNP